jgi:uncharacterized protein (DUF2336 family)
LKALKGNYRLAYHDEYSIAVGAGMNAMGCRVDPLLACLHENVENYKNDKNNDKSQASLLNSVVAMLDANLSTNEKILAADILITLIKQAANDLRKNLANQFALRDDLPDSLLHFLSYGEIDLAEPVLRSSPLLSDTDLMYVIQAKGQEYWHAVAKRDGLSNDVCEVLVTKNDKQTNMTLLQNDTINLGAQILGQLRDFAIDDELFATEYLNYKTLPANVAVTVYWHVSNALRAKIMNQFDIQKSDLDNALQDCVHDFRDTVHHEIHRPTSLMIETANRYHESEMITADLLVQILRQRQGRFFAALFSLKTGLRYRAISEVMKQKEGHSLAVACRASNIDKDKFVSIFLLSRAITMPQSPVNADELKMALRYFETLTHKMAKEILVKSIV